MRPTTLICLAIAVAQACKQAGSPCACVNKPSDHKYFLTMFDGTSCACGACHAHGDHFVADRQRFGCGNAVHACRKGKCVKAAVTDYGPSCFVEEDAGGAVLDASPAVCHTLTGASSCGWSDHFSITVSRAHLPEVDGRPYGTPFNVTDGELASLIEVGRQIEEQEKRVASGEMVPPSANANLEPVAFEPVAFEPVAFDDIHKFLKDELNTTYDTIFPAEPNEYKYWYDQASGHFHGTGFDGSKISVTGCCGAAGHCRNNPAAQCESRCGPLPRGEYRLSQDTTYHGMAHCYVLSHISGDECGRGGFLIHGGSCSSGNPSIGCIVIEDVNVRYKIKGGGHLTVEK